MTLQQIPGVGEKMAQLLQRLGYRRVEQLSGQDPERMFRRLSQLQGRPVDRCVLYVFRCAVYFASNTVHEPEKLKWWYWKD
jgi:hypothetical protein